MLFTICPPIGNFIQCCDSQYTLDNTGKLCGGCHSPFSCRHILISKMAQEKYKEWHRLQRTLFCCPPPFSANSFLLSLHGCGQKQGRHTGWRGREHCGRAFSEEHSSADLSQPEQPPYFSWSSQGHGEEQEGPTGRGRKGGLQKSFLRRGREGGGGDRHSECAEGGGIFHM